VKKALVSVVAAAALAACGSTTPAPVSDLDIATTAWLRLDSSERESVCNLVYSDSANAGRIVGAMGRSSGLTEAQTIAMGDVIFDACLGGVQ
jgi:hypothetical protein